MNDNIYLPFSSQTESLVDGEAKTTTTKTRDVSQTRDVSYDAEGNLISGQTDGVGLQSHSEAIMWEILSVEKYTKEDLIDKIANRVIERLIERSEKAQHSLIKLISERRTNPPCRKE